MEELALNVLDIACNSVRAEATLIVIDIAADTDTDILTISISDNGKGMTEEFLKTVADPFSTTRTTRKVGMGIPLFKMAATDAGGDFSIVSQPGKGTTTTASFVISHIDRMPLGDIASSITALIGRAGDCDIELHYAVNGSSYIFSTAEIKQVLEGIDINSPEIIVYLKEMINENISIINGGIIL